MSIATQMSKIHMGGVFKNQQIKSKLIMITMWKHRQNWQRKYTGRTSTTLKKLLLLMKNTMQNNADNQNNREKPSKVIILFHWRVPLVVIFTIMLLVVWHHWKLWFKIMFSQYLSLKFHMQITIPLKYTKRSLKSID